MFYVHGVRNCCVPAIFERRRGRLGSKISGYGQLAKVAVYFAMSGLPPEAGSEGSARPLRATNPTLAAADDGVGCPEWRICVIERWSFNLSTGRPGSRSA
jgi:hypothetical protein